MKTKICCTFLAVLICLLSLSGCGDSPDHGGSGSNTPAETKETVLPEIAPDFFAVLCDNTDVAFNSLSFYNSLYFTVLSAQPLTTEDIEVSFDQEVPFTYELTSSQDENGVAPEALSSSTSATYQGISWNELAALYEAGSTEEAEALLTSFQERFDAIAEEELPVLYSGKLSLTFSDFTELDGISLNTMMVRVGEKSYEYSLGRVEFDQSAIDISDEFKFWCDIVSTSDMPVAPSTDGTFEVKQLTFTATEGVQVDRMYFYDAPDTVIDSIQVSHTLSDGNTIDYVWDGSTPLTLAKDEAIQVTVTAHDPLFANTVTANTTRYLMVDYTCSGIQSTAHAEVTYRLRINGFDAYAALYDNLDVLSYYTSFLPAYSAVAEAELQ